MERDTYHIGLWNYARNFFWAADKLRGREEIFADIPTYYLYGHAIELAIKSFLVFHGYTEKALRTVGHDLQDAWKQAMENGIDADIEVAETIELIGPYYEAKELEYLVPGGKRFPSVIHMHNTARKLLLAIGKNVAIPEPQLRKIR